MRFRHLTIAIALATAVQTQVIAQAPPPPPPLEGGGGGTDPTPTPTPTPPPTGPTNPTSPVYPTYPIYPGQGGQQFYPGQPGQPGNPGRPGQPGAPTYPGVPGGYPPYGQQQQQPGNPPQQQQQQQPAPTEQTPPPAPPPPDYHIIDMTSADQTIYAVRGDVIRMKGHFSENGRPLDHSFLELDRARSTTDINVQTVQIFDTVGGSVEVRPTDNATSDDYQYDWTATSGDHYLRVGYVTSNRNKKYAQYGHVIVMDEPPFDLTPTPLTSVNDLDVSATLKHSTVMLASKIDVFVDDKQVGSSLQGPPFKFTIPTGKAKPGKHSLKIEAYDSKSGRYEFLDKAAIEVPKRVVLTVPKEATLAKADDRVEVKPTLGAGFKPKKIEYVVKPATAGDEKVAGSAEADPFDIKLDLGSFATGYYTVHAVSYVGDDKFVSDDYPLALNNPFNAAAAAKAAQEAADLKAKQNEENAEKNAAAGLKDHPKLTWTEVNQKVTDTIANFLAARPIGTAGKRWGLVQVTHIRQPNQAQNVYLAAVVVNSPDASNVHAIYSVDLDKTVVTDTLKPW